MSSGWCIRSVGVGDLGWVACRHAEVYAAEYGWGAEFEALVLKIAADFAGGHNAARERGWIVECDGRRAGCIFLMRKTDDAASLRMLLVEPFVRGRGIGQQLIDECLRFAKVAGYARVDLWTNSALAAARTLYERNGFVLVEELVDPRFPPTHLSQSWTLDLAAELQRG